MEIRCLQASDAGVFQDLRLRALRECPSSFSASLEDEQSRTPAQIETFLAGSPERVILGAFSAGRLIGIVGVGREPGAKERHRGFIRSMYVSPERRGTGAGQQLLRRALDAAMDWPGLEQITLAVTAGNTPAVALYTKAGFVEYGRAPRSLCVAGHYFDEIQMVKHLHPVA